jgi:hypothetical protein
MNISNQSNVQYFILRILIQPEESPPYTTDVISNGNIMKEHSNHAPSSVKISQLTNNYFYTCCVNQINHTKHFTNTDTFLLLLPY